ncbi:MAG: fumarylacetoacetate hydrolase family protein [Proteobacteria bacterium]|nr:fumarylacetoacetate hydrolase family protein [Pseudomonadota bacterium]
MALSKMVLEEAAQRLLAASRNVEPIDPLTETYPGITVEEAYRIQLRVMDMKKSAGQVVVGKKIGLTSLAMQAMLGVKEPDYGHILNGMVVMEGEKIPVGELIAPRIEGEIAFVLKEDLKGPGVTLTDVLRCSEGVIPAFEIIDSRIRDWKIKLPDTVADNASSARIVLGGVLTAAQAIDLRTVGMVMEKNGEVLATAAGAAVLGHPAQAVAWLANKLSAYGIVLRKGEVVLSGSLTAAAPVAAGDFFRADFGSLGDVKIKFI